MCAIYAYSIYIHVFVTCTWITNYHTFTYTRTRIHTHTDIHTYHYITFPFHSLRARVHTYAILCKDKDQFAQEVKASVHLFICWFCRFAKTTAQRARHMAWSVTAKSPYGCFQLLPSLSSRPWGTFKSLISCFLTATSGNSLHSSWRGALWLW